MNKKTLYESIMRQVSIEVKKALNESAEYNQTEYYIADNLEFRLVKDLYEDGEQPNTEQRWDDTYVNKEIFTTPKALIEKISDIYDIPVENAIIFDNDVIMETITDKDCIPLTASEKKQWQNGEIDGYIYTVRFSVVKCNMLNHEQLVQMTGIESYD